MPVIDSPTAKFLITPKAFVNPLRSSLTSQNPSLMNSHIRMVDSGSSYSSDNSDNENDNKQQLDDTNDQ